MLVGVALFRRWVGALVFWRQFEARCWAAAAAWPRAWLRDCIGGGLSNWAKAASKLPLVATKAWRATSEGNPMLVRLLSFCWSAGVAVVVLLDEPGLFPIRGLVLSRPLFKRGRRDELLAPIMNSAKNVVWY